jgi:hypothetical protein
MPIPRQPSRWTQFLGSPLPYDISQAALSLAVVCLGVVVAASHVAGVSILAIGLLSCAAQVAKAVVVARKAGRKESVHDLAGCLHTLRAVVVGGQDESGLRMTIYVPVADGEKLEQALNYVGNARAGHGVRRRFSSRAGAIGDAFRNKALSTGRRETANQEEFIYTLTKAYGYTREEAAALSPETRSWAAMPIFDGHERVQGVLYADAADVNFFTDERLVAIQFACVGIAYFVGQRYA